MTRPRLALLRGVAADVAQAARRRARARRRGSAPPQRPDEPTSDELARRLDATRERLRREIPPSDAD